MDHDAEEVLSLRLGEVVSQDGEPCFLGSFLVGVDGVELLGFGLAGDEEGFKFVVGGGGIVAGGEDRDESVKGFGASSHVGIFTA